MTTDSPRWVKSSYSNNGGQCIEIATNLVTTHGVIPVRDSKNPDGPALALTPGAWAELVDFARGLAT
ncbi:DUF397 domain-containing protein [Streptomyces albofaciens JCM 4342]|uniref:DUF397 domain-containing protein n=1 Tax=Streptomyces albofaciens TaxID=66866 RepID=UPI00123B7EDE|nr:DUF397 domain-containing protein [Streptomyces albofaciens]KAA6214421.1 DUF397 domain-containing protein [Streptomyces albofaciens JCM 4342]